MSAPILTRLSSSAEVIIRPDYEELGLSMLPFRILNFPDLTSEGAYPMGGCVAGAMIAQGFDPVYAMLAAVAAGFLAGCSTALIHLRFGINTLLAGILVLTMDRWSL